MVKSFRYTNALGVPKKLVVAEPNAEGKYPVTLWEMIHGEMCGSGTMTKDELNDYLDHFGIKERF